MNTTYVVREVFFTSSIIWMHSGHFQTHTSLVLHCSTFSLLYACKRKRNEASSRVIESAREQNQCNEPSFATLVFISRLCKGTRSLSDVSAVPVGWSRNLSSTRTISSSCLALPGFGGITIAIARRITAHGPWLVRMIHMSVHRCQTHSAPVADISSAWNVVKTHLKMCFLGIVADHGTIVCNNATRWSRVLYLNHYCWARLYCATTSHVLAAYAYNY